MSNLIEVTSDIRYGGQDLKTGKRYVCPGLSALALVAAGKAKLINKAIRFTGKNCDKLYEYREH